MQGLLATTSVIALVVIAFNLLLTFGLLLIAAVVCQRLIRKLSLWTERALAQSGPYVHQAAHTVDRAGRTIVQPVVQAESVLAQTRVTLAHLDPRRDD